MGDSYMRPQDANLAAETVSLSLKQILDAAGGVIKIDYSSVDEPIPSIPDSFNVCTNNYMPSIDFEDDNLITLIADVLIQTPVPGLSTGLGELPRFRTELEMFIGVVPALRGATVHAVDLARHRKLQEESAYKR